MTGVKIKLCACEHRHVAMKTKYVKFPEPTAELIGEIAEAKGQSFSSVVRELVDDGLEANSYSDRLKQKVEQNIDSQMATDGGGNADNESD